MSNRSEYTVLEERFGFLVILYKPTGVWHTMLSRSLNQNNQYVDSDLRWVTTPRQLPPTIGAAVATLDLYAKDKALVVIPGVGAREGFIKMVVYELPLSTWRANNAQGAGHA